MDKRICKMGFNSSFLADFNNGKTNPVPISCVPGLNKELLNNLVDLFSFKFNSSFFVKVDIKKNHQKLFKNMLECH